MPIVVDNNFSRDSHAMRAEILNAIQGNFASIQTELNPPANIVTWAVDFYVKYAELRKVVHLFFLRILNLRSTTTSVNKLPPLPAEDTIL